VLVVLLEVFFDIQNHILWEHSLHGNFLCCKEGLPQKGVELASLLLEEVVASELPCLHLEEVVGVDYEQHHRLVGWEIWD